MKKQNFLRISFIILIVLLLMVTAKSSFAGAPDQSVFLIDETVVWPGVYNPCGFDLTYRLYGQLRVTEWFDQGGQITREKTAYGQVTLVWSAGGNDLVGQMNENFSITYSSATERIIDSTGSAWLTTVPGYGVAGGRAGHIRWREVWNSATSEWEWVENILDVGLRPSFEDAQAICGYLAQ